MAIDASLLPPAASPYDRLIFRFFGWMHPWKDNRIAAPVIPNLVTSFRVVILWLAPVLYHAIQNHNTIQAVLLLLAVGGVAATDAFDGSFARLLRKTTSVGAILDPIFDKLFSLVLIYYFWKLADAGNYEWWPNMKYALGAVVAVELLLVVAALYGMVMKFSVKANDWGKRKFNVQIAAIVVAYLALISPLALPILLFAASFGLGIASLAGHWFDREVAH